MGKFEMYNRSIADEIKLRIDHILEEIEEKLGSERDVKSLLEEASKTLGELSGIFKKIRSEITINGWNGAGRSSDANMSPVVKTVKDLLGEYLYPNADIIDFDEEDDEDEC